MKKDINYLTEPVAKISGEITVPGDKSISHRALLLSAIAEGNSEIDGLLMGADNLATLKALQDLGVHIQSEKSGHFKIAGVGLAGLKQAVNMLDLGNSGTGIRLMAGLLAGQKFSSQLTGDESLCSRPMGRIVNPLRTMGANIEMTAQQTAPLKIFPVAQLQGIQYALPVASAQVKSCLLLAGLYAEGETCIAESSPSRDHTERMLQTFQYPLQFNSQKVLLKGKSKLTATSIKIPSDISSAAFFIVAATIIPNSEIILKQVGINPTRIGVITILQKMGANIEMINRKNFGEEPVADIVVKSAQLKGIHIPEETVPLAIDEFPVILIAAACAEGETILHGAKELRVKETDRIAAMAAGLTQLGIINKTFEDGISVKGGVLTGGTIDSFGDHRIAMAFAIAGAVAKDKVMIQNCANVETSFPNFVELAKNVGLKIT